MLDRKYIKLGVVSIRPWYGGVGLHVGRWGVYMSISGTQR